MLLERTALNTATNGVGNAGNVRIEARDRVSLNNAKISSAAEVSASGSAGKIEILTNDLEINNLSRLITASAGGQGGDISIRANRDVSINRSDVFSFISNNRSNIKPNVRGGNIFISANTLNLLNESKLNSSVVSGQGIAGNIELDVKGKVIFDNAFISSLIQSESKGTGGNIFITAGELQLLNGSTFSSATEGQGNAGDIVVIADQILLSQAGILSSVQKDARGNAGLIGIVANGLQLVNRSQMSTTTKGQGNAGLIVLDVRDRISLLDASSLLGGSQPTGVGNGDNIRVFTGLLELRDGAQISASALGDGDAGDIQVDATNSILIFGSNQQTGLGSGSSSLLTTVTTDGVGGSITLNTPLLRITNGGVVDSRTFGAGNSGSIIVNVNRLELLEGGQIIATTQGDGKAGSLTVNANDQVLISGRDPDYFDRLERVRNAAAEFARQNGSQLTPDSIFQRSTASFSPESGIIARSISLGEAGNITISTSRLLLKESGTVSTSSNAVNGGDIILNIAQLTELRNGGTISTNAGTAQQGGNGGNLRINSPNGFLVAVPNENSDISANAFTGQGGRVEISAQGIFGIQFRNRPTPQSEITASSEFGISGTVTLNTPNLDPNRGLIELPSSPSDPSNQIDPNCSPQAQSTNSFTSIGRGGIPASPGERLNEDAIATGWVTLNPKNDRSVQSTSSAVQKPPMIEAQSWRRDRNGDILLLGASPVTASSHPCQ